MSLTLLACSSSDDSADENSSSSTFTKFGIIDIVDPEANNTLEMTAVFFETDTPILLSNITAVNTPPSMNTDSCELEISSDSTTDVISFIDNPDTQVTPISAGDIITITGTPGTVAELSESATTFGIGYFGDSTLGETDSTGLVADIPGSAFPAFLSIAIPDVEPFVLTSEMSQFGTEIDATFTWTPSATPESYVTLYTDVNQATLTPSTPEVIQHIVLDCILVDDGSFELPQAIQSQLTDAGVNSLPVNIGREAVNIVQQADVVVIATRSSGDI